MKKKDELDILDSFLKELLQKNKDALVETDFLLFFCLEMHWQDICSSVAAFQVEADIIKRMQIKKVVDAELYIQVFDPALRYVCSLQLETLKDACNATLKTIEIVQICNELGLSASSLEGSFTVKKVVLSR